MGYRHLPRLRDALKRELKIEHDDIEDESRVSNQESRRVSTRNGLDSRRPDMNPEITTYGV